MKINRRISIYGLLLGYIFFTPLIGQINFIKPYAGTLDIFFPLTIFFLIYSFMEKKLKMSIAYFFLIFFMIDVLISMIWLYNSYGSEPFFQSFLRVIRLFEFFLPFFLCFTINIDKSKIDKAAAIFIISGFLSLVIGMFVFIFQIHIKGVTQSYSFLGFHLMRAGGVYGNTGPYGILIAVWTVVTLLFAVYFVSNKFYKMLIIFVTLVISTANIIASLSRASVLFILVAFSVWILVNIVSFRKRNLKTVVNYTISFLLLMLLLFLFLDIVNPSIIDIMYRRFIQQTLLSSDLSYVTSGRIDIWKQYYMYFFDNPLTGIGYKGIIFALKLPPDNDYLSLLVETGIIGFLSFSLFNLILIALLFKRAVRLNDNHAKIGISILIGLLASALTADVFTYWNIIPIIYIYIGLIVNWKGGDVRVCLDRPPLE